MNNKKGSSTYMSYSNNSCKYWYFGRSFAIAVFIVSLVMPFNKMKFIEVSLAKPQVEVPIDLEAEKGDQKNVDAGHSPWKLDPVFVAQVFVSLQISPKGIQGDYPIKEEDLKIVRNTGKEVIIEVSGSNSPIKRVYLKRIIRQDNTGIWTIVGYDPVNKK